MTRQSRLNSRVGTQDLATKTAVTVDGVPQAALLIDTTPITPGALGAYTSAETDTAISNALLTAFTTLYKLANPTIATGAAAVGTAATTDGGKWSTTPDAYSYQWNRNGVPISGATSSSYTPVSADNGTNLTVSVGVTKSGFSPNSGTSLPAVVSAGAVTVTNLHTNPRAGTDRTNWAGQAGGGTMTASNPSTGGPTSNAPSFYRQTWSVAAATVGVAAWSVVTGTAGSTYSITQWLRVSYAGASVKFTVAWYNSTGTYISDTLITATVTPAQNVWTQLTGTVTAPTGAVTARIAIFTNTGSAFPGIGDTLDMTGVMFVAGSTVWPYRDGSSTGWTWSGTTNSSTSTGPIPVGSTS